MWFSVVGFNSDKKKKTKIFKYSTQDFFKLILKGNDKLEMFLGIVFFFKYGMFAYVVGYILVKASLATTKKSF